MKLYQLTVLRSKKEEEEEEDVITIPSVDNMELIRCEITQSRITSWSFHQRVCFSLTAVLSFSGSEWWGDERNSHFLHRALLHAGVHLPHRYRPGGVQPLEREQTQALLLRTTTKQTAIVKAIVVRGHNCTESETLLSAGTGLFLFSFF